MKDTLKAGASVTRRFDIDAGRTIDFMGDELRVYSTPNMIRDIEHTCRDLLMEHSAEGEDSVGAHIAVDHMGATLLGMFVDVSAKVVEVEGPRVTFEIEVHDPIEQVGRGKHVRYVINMEKQGERLRKKAQKVKDAG